MNVIKNFWRKKNMPICEKCKEYFEDSYVKWGPNGEVICVRCIEEEEKLRGMQLEVIE
tara:strand:- start:169 stop:342 length:174 start_codon:yes stop_codon:yes gene_type:complete